MTDRVFDASLQLDHSIDSGAPAPLVDAAVLDAAHLLQIDAALEAPMPGAREVRLRVLESIVDDELAARTPRRRRRALGRRVLVHAMTALLACGATAAIAAQTNTAPGDAVRSVARTAARALDLPMPAPSARPEARDADARPTPRRERERPTRDAAREHAPATRRDAKRPPARVAPTPQRPRLDADGNPVDAFDPNAPHRPQPGTLDEPSGDGGAVEHHPQPHPQPQPQPQPQQQPGGQFAPGEQPLPPISDGQPKPPKPQPQPQPAPAG